MTAAPTQPMRLAVLADFPDEGWPSMDLCAEMLAAHAPTERVCPPFRRRFSRLPSVGRRRAAFNADRLVNRFFDYPRYARHIRHDFDAYHLSDHTYSQVILELPAERTGVFLHDLDAFRCLLEPALEPRPRWFRGMAHRILSGLKQASVVFYSTAAVRAAVERFGLLPADRLIHAPYGVAAEFHADADPDGPHPLPELHSARFILHVGSCIPRKRTDTLLEVFAELRRAEPTLRLVQIGGDWPAADRERIARHDLGPAIHQVRGLPRSAVAALYRRAALVLQPSDAEGFGLPVIEALASGVPVVASDIPVLREVGGTVVTFCPVGDVAAWVATARSALDGSVPDRIARLAWARQYSWPAHARTIVTAYRRLLGLAH